MSDKAGGVAFPCGHEGGQKGMTLRDYFAAKAMAGMLANHELLTRVDREFQDSSTREAVSIYAYGLADAMLKAREK